MSQQYAENNAKNKMQEREAKKGEAPAPAPAKCDYYKYDCLNRGCHKGVCYRIDSTDTRCCGLCYCCCPAKNISRLVDKDRCDFFPESFAEYLESGYFRTVDGPAREDCFCTVLCLPIKLPLFLPCFLGSLFNDALNKWCCAFAHQDRNYIF